MRSQVTAEAAWSESYSDLSLLYHCYSVIVCGVWSTNHPTQPTQPSMIYLSLSVIMSGQGWKSNIDIYTQEITFLLSFVCHLVVSEQMVSPETFRSISEM